MSHRLIIIVLLLLFIFQKVGANPSDSLLFSCSSNFNIAQDTFNTWSVCWIDYNNDGWDDLFIPTYSYKQPNTLYKNNQDGTFSIENNLSNIENPGNAVSASWADFNNDGYNDVLVSENIKEGNFLYQNQCDGTFKNIVGLDLTEKGINSHGTSWADYNIDGFLDALILEYNEVGNIRLFQNNRGLNFTELNDTSLKNQAGISIGATWADVNNDRYPDFFVPYNGSDNYLYINNQDNSFTAINMGDNAKSVGSSFADFDNDGDVDLFVANSSEEYNLLYTNDGKGNFTLVNDSPITEDRGHSHGSCWGDFDNDGWLDLYVTNDRNHEKFLYFNNGDGTFKKDTSEIIIAAKKNSFGVACSDYDKDGDLDLYISNHSNEKNFFFTNNTHKKNWIGFRLQGTQSNHNAIGSKVRIKATIDNKTFWQVREISSQTGGGAGSQNSLMIHFGLNDTTSIDSLIIEWISGTTQVFTDVEANQYYQIEEFKTSLFAPITPTYNDCPSDQITPSTSIVYPNPSINEINILANLSDDMDDIGNIEIFDTKGALVYLKNGIDLKYIHTVDLSNFTNGMYIAVIMSDQQTLTEKFIKR